MKTRLQWANEQVEWILNGLSLEGRTLHPKEFGDYASERDWPWTRQQCIDVFSRAFCRLPTEEELSYMSPSPQDGYDDYMGQFKDD